MATYQVRSPDETGYGDAVIFVLTYAQQNPEHFQFGPLNRARLLASGLTISGDCIKLANAMREAHPHLEVTGG